MFPAGAELKSIAGDVRPKEEVVEQAEAFLNEYYESLKKYVTVH